MRKYIVTGAWIVIALTLIATLALAERVHVGDGLTTDDLSGHIMGSSNITVTPGGDSVTLNTIQPITTTSTPTFANVISTTLTANRLLSTNGAKSLKSVSALSSWIAGTSNQITVGDDGDGSITLTTPQNLDTAASFQVGKLSIGNTPGTYEFEAMKKSGTGNTTARFRSHGGSWQFDIANTAGNNTVIAASDAFAINFTKNNIFGTYGYILYGGPTFTDSNRRNTLEFGTVTAGSIDMRPANTRRWRFDVSGNLIGSNTAGATGMINSVSIMPGECGTSNPTGMAILCAEKMTFSNGSKSVLRTRSEQANAVDREFVMQDMNGYMKFYSEPATTFTDSTTYTILNSAAGPASWSTGGIANVGMIASTDTGIKVLNAGRYFVSMNGNFEYSTNGVTVHLRVAKNGNVLTGSEMIGCESDSTANVAMNCSDRNGLSLAANDTLAVFANTSSTAGSLNIHGITLEVKNH